ncbi:hypothetical protein FRB94_004740 [Tulasnella sp. JGI-2019a]|nr:hypothetical protein FRB93_011396 [Tulasnella sp. JGI-2019a]KAG9012930.1 hypothetical protein FRB94_004740 [Tulasnella sp. JGI-2019a]KAG9036683.1 hypothetical protein FRB95_008267 [Tulasnella sp. JGI-2019a]
MIDKSGQNPITPIDQPPAYDTAVAESSNARSLSSITVIPNSPPSSSSYFPNDSKGRSFDLNAQPITPVTAARLSPTPSSPVAPAPPKQPAGWIGHLIGTQQSKQDLEVKQTVLGLLRGVIHQGEGQHSATIDIIQSCIAACRARGLSFEKIAQERSIQGHTPLYWSIVKIGSALKSHSTPASPRPQNLSPSDSNTNMSELLSVFDVLAALPLTQDTYSDAIQACLLISSHTMFERLLPHSPTHALQIPGENDTSNRDIITVVNAEDVEGAITGAFRAQALVKDFQRRLRVLKEVKINFVARGRMWSLKFFIWSQGRLYPSEYHIPNVRNGSWVVMLELIENSPDTWLDSRLTIGRPNADPPSRSHSTKSPIVFRMKSSGRGTQLSGDEAQKRHFPARGPIYHLLSDDAQASSLQFDGCPYIREDGSLDLLLEAKLVEPSRNPDCVFM